MRRGPKRSTNQPSSGTSHASVMTKIEKATWIAARGQPCRSWIGCTNSVQPYCRLAIITMQATPAASCSQRVLTSAFSKVSCGRHGRKPTWRPNENKEEPPVDSVLQAPFKPIDFLSRDISVERRADGTILLQSNHQLKPYEKHVPAFLAKWAREAPDRVWLAQRRGPGREWLKVPYAEARKQVDAVTQALLDRGFGPDKAVMILSSNSIEFALLSMAAMQARAPLAPVSPAYSMMSTDHAKLKYVFYLIKPGLVFVQNGEIYADALADLALDGVLLVHVDKPPPK